MENTYHVTNNEKMLRFEVALEGDIAFLEYRWYKKSIAFIHTQVPAAFEDRGIAATLAHTALEYARERNISIMIYCPYIASYLKRHPQYQLLINKKYIYL